MGTEEKIKKESKSAEQTEIQKPTAFSLAEKFLKDNKLVYIDGRLHIFEKNRQYYVPVAKEPLERYIFQQYKREVEATGSLQIVKKCAQILMCSQYEYVEAAENKMLLCVYNGYVDLTNLDTAYLWMDLCKDYPTYRIQATLTDGLLNWYGMKQSQKTAMDEFLAHIANDNQVVIDRIWQMIGYLLAPDRKAKCLFVLQGVPNSGKSLLGNVIKSFFPADRVASLDIDQLGRRTATSMLVDKSINISMDLPNKPFTPLATRSLKLMTGNDDITVEYENGRFLRYQGNCKFLFATNHPLTLKGSDSGLEDRIVCIPFTKTVPVEKRKRNLLDRLIQERNYILDKALAHYRDLRNANYVFAGAELKECKADIRYLPTAAEDTDAHLCEFVDTQCKIVPLDEGATFSCVLYDAYRDYCSQRGYTPVNDQGAFSRRLNKCYSGQIEKARIRQGDVNLNGFRGIVLHMIYYI